MKQTLTHRNQSGGTDTRTTAAAYTHVVEARRASRKPTKKDAAAVVAKRVEQDAYGESGPTGGVKAEEAREYRSLIKRWTELGSDWGTYSWHKSLPNAAKAKAALDSRQAKYAPVVGLEYKVVGVTPADAPEAKPAKAKAKPKARTRKQRPLSENQLAVLGLLDRHDALTPLDLKTETGLTGMQLGGVISTLLMRGLITRGSEDGSIGILSSGRDAVAS